MGPRGPHDPTMSLPSLGDAATAQTAGGPGPAGDSFHVEPAHARTSERAPGARLPLLSWPTGGNRSAGSRVRLTPGLRVLPRETGTRGRE